MRLYEILGVPDDCSATDIERAYRAKRSGYANSGLRGWLVQRLQATADIDYAFAILSDVGQLRNYDGSPNNYLKFHPLPPSF